jgi:hypothetical protein
MAFCNHCAEFLKENTVLTNRIQVLEGGIRDICENTSPGGTGYVEAFCKVMRKLKALLTPTPSIGEVEK